MNKKTLRIIFEAFERMNRVWEGEGGEAGAGSAGASTATAEGGSEGGDGAAEGGSEGTSEGGASSDRGSPAGEQKPFDINTYRGDKRLNPDQRPLREFSRKGLSKDTIDRMLRDDPSLMLTQEEIDEEALAEKKNKEEAAGKGPKKDEKKTVDKGKTEEKTNETDLDPKDFLEKAGLTQEDFAKLPEKAQENLVKQYEEFNGVDKRVKEAETKYTTLKKDIDTLMSDPVVSARREELETGKAFVANRVQGFTDTDLSEINKLLALDKNSEALTLMNKMLTERSQDAVKHERAVLDRRIADTKARTDAHTTLMKLGSIDKRLAIADSDYKAIVPGHKDFDVMNDVVEFCKKNGITVSQINTFGPEKLYKLIAAEKGWDKEREANIHEQGKQSLLQKLKNPTKVHTLDPGKRSSAAVSGKDQMAETREALVEDIANGNISNWEKLLDAADGSPRRIMELRAIREEGVRKARENKKIS
jgi:hypothetical protein